mmetsp:Transcript_17105/g.56009  ORF Transcript_17105/g.56009 Transcript_17105/m.56009 type:complete len:250 (-) Transcript_17105:255-1004(-)
MPVLVGDGVVVQQLAGRRPHLDVPVEGRSEQVRLLDPHRHQQVGVLRRNLQRERAGGEVPQADRPVAVGGEQDVGRRLHHLDRRLVALELHHRREARRRLCKLPRLDAHVVAGGEEVGPSLREAPDGALVPLEGLLEAVAHVPHAHHPLPPPDRLRARKEPLVKHEDRLDRRSGLDRVNALEALLPRPELDHAVRRPREQLLPPLRDVHARDGIRVAGQLGLLRRQRARAAAAAAPAPAATRAAAPAAP